MDIIHHESVVLLICNLGRMEVLLIHSQGRMEVHSSIVRLVHLRHTCSVSQGFQRNSHLIILLRPLIISLNLLTTLLHSLITPLNIHTIPLNHLLIFRNLHTNLPNLPATLLNLPITLLRPLTIHNSPSTVLRVGSYHHKVVEEPLYRLLRTSEVDHSFLNLCHIFLHSFLDVLLSRSSSLCRYTLDGATVVIQLLLDRLSPQSNGAPSPGGPSLQQRYPTASLPGGTPRAPVGPGASPQPPTRPPLPGQPGIQVMADDQANRSGQFVTNLKGQVPPLTTTQFTVLDQGNASPRLIRSSVYNVPVSPDMLKQTNIPLALSIAPLAELPDGEQPPPVVDLGTLGPVRCIRCKAYMGPFMTFIDGGRRFSCPFCKASTEVPQEYFQHLDHTGQRLDKYERPELCMGAYEYVCTKEYCRRSKMRKATLRTP
ncbi:Protein transport protein Sec24D [Amphibalanus amphitrite]|uniref:Protein transport protein Sec24D n=1 Tax=Amphibalanus amphitrite TaxID=1232801 RepID=A0A6A4WF26_AMPAM|nr:Protein transport protein Sec24D [Amphibalanus amphitrite]